MKSALRAFSAVILLLSLASFACSVFVPQEVKPNSETQEPFSATRTATSADLRETQGAPTEAAVITLTPNARGLLQNPGCAAVCVLRMSTVNAICGSGMKGRSRSCW